MESSQGEARKKDKSIYIHRKQLNVARLQESVIFNTKKQKSRGVMLITFKCIKNTIAKNEIMILVFIDSNVVMLATRISDNNPVSKHRDTDSEALELICRLVIRIIKENVMQKEKVKSHLP